MSQFVFLYRNTVQAEQEFSRSPEEMQKSMQKWMAWMKDLAEKGHIKDHGNPLEPGGKVVKGKQKTITDGPYAETKEQLLGFYVIDCENLEAALEVAKDLAKANPGGAYEVRPLRLFAPGSLDAAAASALTT